MTSDSELEIYFNSSGNFNKSLNRYRVTPTHWQLVGPSSGSLRIGSRFHVRLSDSERKRTDWSLVASLVEGFSVLSSNQSIDTYVTHRVSLTYSAQSVEVFSVGLKLTTSS